MNDLMVLKFMKGYQAVQQFYIIHITIVWEVP